MRTRTSQLVLAASATVTFSALAHAQDIRSDSGPVIVGERTEQWRSFQLVSFSSALEYLGTRQKQTTRQSGQPDQTDTEDDNKETFDIFAESYLGAKNFIDLTTKLRFELDERSYTSDSTASNGSTTSKDLLYDVNAHVFGASSFPFDIYAKHDQQKVNRDFGSSLDVNTTEYGVNGMYQSKFMPTTVQISHGDTSQHDTLGDYNYQFKRDTFATQTMFLFSRDHRLESQYQFDSISENQTGVYSTDYTRNDLSLTDTLTFGEKQNELRSYFKYFDQGGIYAQRTIQLQEQLRLIHSETLETRYNTALYQLTVNGTQQDTYLGTASIRHKLFESLVSNGIVGYQRFTVDDFTSDQRFVGGLLEYTKKIAPGVLSVDLGFNYNNQENSEQGSTIAVVDQPYTFSSLMITVDRRNIVNGSIVVTGPGGFPTYVEGVDYTVQYYPDRVEITPIPGQGITPGQTVLVDYDVGPEPASTIDTITTSGAVRYTFTDSWLEGLSVSASYRKISHNLSTADPGAFALDDVTQTNYAVEYRRWGLALKGELEYHESTQNPYDAQRLQALYDARLGINSALSLDATYEMTTYKDPTNQVNFFHGGVRWIEQLSQTLSLDTRLIYRNEQNDASGDSHGVDARLGLNWHLRQSSAHIYYGQNLYGSSTSDTTNQFIEIGFRREF